jgi:hypothetical protein
MANGKLDHPGTAQLSAFGLGQLDAAEAAAIERHVAGCSACCQTLWTLPDDRLVNLLRQAFTAPPASEATTLLPSAAPPSSAPQVPAELAEHPRYRIVEVLGTGGMGVVYKAEHRFMERLVALKVIDRSLTGNPAVVERFRREVKAAGALSHPNIVHAYDAEQAGDSHFLVMEYVEGTTLARLVEREGPLPVARACDAIRQAARGLQRAHEHGLVHRDIKPHNLMLTPQGVVKILDFGLARLVREAAPSSPATADTAPGVAGAPGLTQLGMVMGTADYMAPEQADNAHTADIRADIYSLGCTLYFLLTGQPPFPEGTMLDKLLAHRQGTPRPLSDFRKDLPPGLDRVIQRMMDRDPARRYQTPAELAEALRPFLAAPKRPPWRVTAVVLLLVALATAAMSVLVCGGIAMYWWQSGGGPMAPTTVLQTFPPGQKLLTGDGVTIEPDGWRIEVQEPQTIRLFEAAPPDLENCRVIYQAKLKTDKLQGKAYLEMWCRSPDFGEAFSRDLNHPLSGTTDWTSFETPFYLKKGERADLLKLNLVIEGTGTVWIKDVSLRKGSLPMGF